MSLQTQLDGWNDKDWEVLTNGIKRFYVDLMMSGKEVNNNSLFASLESVSRFELLREILYDFLNKEKENAFNELMSLIKAELTTYGMTLRKDIQAVSNGQTEIDRQIKEAEKEKRRLNLALVKVQQKATPGAIESTFKFIDTELQQLSKLASIGEVRTKYLQIIKEGLSKQKEFFEALKADFARHVGQFDFTSVTFRSLDLDDLERKANDKATNDVTDFSRAEIRLVKEGGWSSDAEYETYYPHTKKQTDFEQKRREFTALVVQEGRWHGKAFQEGIKVKVKEFFDIVSKSIEEKTSATIERLKNYKQLMANSEVLLEGLRAKLAEVERQLMELKKFEN